VPSLVFKGMALVAFKGRPLKVEKTVLSFFAEPTDCAFACIKPMLANRIKHAILITLLF
jgi:hypothetical protein